MREHLKRIKEALERYETINHRLAIDEPDNDFEHIVNAWNELQGLHEELKDLIKPLAAAEKRLRDGLAASLAVYFGEDLKEGVNNYELSNHRKLKFNHSVKREVDKTQIVAAREAYVLTSPTVVFDELLRVKYELEKKPYNSLDAHQAKAVSRMLTVKPASPTLELD